eukprot:1138303-Pelagomonas_calceolata.AAC.1
MGSLGAGHLRSLCMTLMQPLQGQLRRRTAHVTDDKSKRPLVETLDSRLLSELPQSQTCISPGSTRPSLTRSEDAFGLAARGACIVDELGGSQIQCRLGHGNFEIAWTPLQFGTAAMPPTCNNPEVKR